MKQKILQQLLFDIGMIGYCVTIFITFLYICINPTLPGSIMISCKNISDEYVATV